MIRLAAFAACLLATACGGKSTPPQAATATPSGAPGVVTLKELQPGDRACYVVIESATGEQSIEGDFALCAGGERDASALVGKPIVYRTERANVQAAACEGDPECTASDEVDLVVTISAAP